MPHTYGNDDEPAAGRNQDRVTTDNPLSVSDNNPFMRSIFSDIPQFEGFDEQQSGSQSLRVTNKNGRAEDSFRVLRHEATPEKPCIPVERRSNNLHTHGSRRPLWQGNPKFQSAQNPIYPPSFQQAQKQTYQSFEPAQKSTLKPSFQPSEKPLSFQPEPKPTFKSSFETAQKLMLPSSFQPEQKPTSPPLFLPKQEFCERFTAMGLRPSHQPLIPPEFQSKFQPEFQPEQKFGDGCRTETEHRPCFQSSFHPEFQPSLQSLQLQETSDDSSGIGMGPRSSSRLEMMNNYVTMNDTTFYSEKSMNSLLGEGHEMTSMKPTSMTPPSNEPIDAKKPWLHKHVTKLKFIKKADRARYKALTEQQSKAEKEDEEEQVPYE